MIAKSVGKTMGDPPSHHDPQEFDIKTLGSDEVLVRIDGREANRASLNTSCRGEDTTHGSQEICGGIPGCVMEVPGEGRCASCDAGQRERAATRFDEEMTKNSGNGTSANLIVVRASELCVVSVIVDWQKPISA
jgi:hypothetical protein